MRWILALTLSCLTAVALVGCGGETEADVEARLRAARADSVAMAEQLYDAAVFDTISWESLEARINRGQVVWRASCEKCHGREGRGDGPAAQQIGIEVPSFLAPDWTLAYEMDSLRHRIFVGHEGEMPNWGLHVRSIRDIDAAAAYINKLVAPTE